MLQDSTNNKKILPGKREFALLVVSSIAGVFIAILLVEIYFWKKNENSWVGPGIVFDSELGWSNLKNSSSVHRGITYTTNSLGFRSAEIDPVREHVLVAGDSVAYGLGVSDNETVSYHLGQNMPDLQVLNLGVPGYSIDQYYLALKRHIHRTRPKHIVVIIFATNDFRETTFDQMFGVSKPFFLIDKGVLVNTRPVIPMFTCQNLASKSWLVKKISSSDKIREIFCNEKRWDQVDQYTKNLTALLKAIIDLASAHQAGFLFVTSPSLPVIRAGLTEDPALPANQLEAFRLQKSNDVEFLNYYRMVVKFFQDYGNITPLDFSRELLLASEQTDPEEFYAFAERRDQHHLSSKGNKLLADTIFRELRNLPPGTQSAIATVSQAK